MDSTEVRSTDPRRLVIENDDLWSAVLRQLCARQLCLASTACRSHRALQPALLSERNALFVTFGPSGRHLTRHIALTERCRDTGGGSELPRRCDRWKSNSDASDWRFLPPRPGVHESALGVFLSDTTLKIFDRPLPTQDGTFFLRQVLSRLPALAALSLDLGKPYRNKIDPEYKDYVDKLERDGSPHGPAPLALLPHGVPLVELRLKDAVAHGKLLLMALVSFRRTLLRLDASGLGDVVLPVLLQVGLEQLQLLRVGETMDSRASRHHHPDELDLARNADAEWPRRVRLQHLGEACPALTALDVGFASIDGGVQFDDLAALCSRAQQGYGKLNRAPGRFRHLDLSQVMTYRDFDRAVAILGRWAPALTSLAIYGLHVSDEALGVLGQSCRQLSTLHLVACCDHTARGLEQLLLHAAALRRLDLSFGLAPVEPLRAWLSGRGAEAPPARATLIDAYEAEERRLLHTAAQARTLLDAAAGPFTLIGRGGAVTKNDSDDAVGHAFEVRGGAVAQYEQGSFSMWMKIQQALGLRIMDGV